MKVPVWGTGRVAEGALPSRERHRFGDHAGEVNAQLAGGGGRGREERDGGQGGQKQEGDARHGWLDGGAGKLSRIISRQRLLCLTLGGDLESEPTDEVRSRLHQSSWFGNRSSDGALADRRDH